jgi:hypothetical protein
VLAHLGKAGPAVFTIEQGEECQHDRTPLSDHARDAARQPFPAIFAIRPKRLRQRGKLCRLEPAEEIISRRRVRNSVRCPEPPEQLFIKIKFRRTTRNLNYSATFRYRSTLVAGKTRKGAIMRKTALVLATAATLGLSAVTAPSPAEARGWGWGGALAGGLIAGALIGGLASSAYGYGPGYGYYGGYGYPAYAGGYGYGGYGYGGYGYGGYGYPAYSGGYAPAYYGGYATTAYAPVYSGYRYRRVVRPAYAFYAGPRYVHRWHRHYRRW